MKKLNVSQMENLQGGANSRNCLVLGVLTGLAGIAGMAFWSGTALLAGGGFAATGASSNCF